ncbi:MAG: hypothetical protein LBR66_02660 [Candidatus Symbiothrix sp.]|jgi:hypothetical protein|nr:hypothetical protein [Candidatus Symbiothrix sp.]
MRKILFLVAAFALNSMFVSIYAQDNSSLTDKELSERYKWDIAIANSEIKTLKLKLKADKGNPEIEQAIASKEKQIKDLKAKKKIADAAVKSKAASEKAAKKAEKAKAKVEQAQKDAEKARKDVENAQKEADKAAKEAQKLKEKAN